MFNFKGILFSETIKIDDAVAEVLLFDNKDVNVKLYNEDVVLDFLLENQSKQNNFYIVGINPVLDSFDIQYNNHTYYNGDKVSNKDKQIRSYVAVEYLKIPADTIVPIHIRIHNQKELLNYRLLLVSQNQFLKVTNRDSLFFGFFIGMFSMFLLLLISMYLFSNNIFFYKYIRINIITVFIYFYFSGFGYLYIWQQFNWLQILLPTILFALYTLAHASFFKGFFNVSIEFPKLNKLLNIYKFILFFFVMYSIFRLVFTFSDTKYFGFFMNVIYFLFGLYVILSFYIALKTYFTTKRRESVWVISGMVLQSFGWLVFFNTIYQSIPAFNAISRFRFFDSFIFISQFNFSMYVLEFTLITFFIVINYKKIIVQNDISYNRLLSLQQRNLKDYLKSIEQTRFRINNYLEKNILKDIKQIRAKFEELIFFKEISKLNNLILKDFDNMEADLQRIMNDNNISGLIDISLVDLIEYIFSQTVWNIKHELIYDKDEIQNFTCNEVFNNHLYRIIQELVNNSIKHATASDIVIYISIENKKLKLVFLDNGNIQDKKNMHKGLGLLNIENRLKEFGGELQITNEVRWEVKMIVPIKNIMV